MKDQTTVNLNAPALYWMRRGTNYKYVKTGDPGKYTEHIYADILGDRSSRMVDALDELYPSGMFHPADPEKVSEIFFRILKLYRIGWKRNIAEIGFLLEKILFIAYESSVSGHAAPEDLYGLDKIAELFRSDPFQKYDFNEIAENLQISPDHFRRIFRQKHKLTPHAYLHHQRMLRAVELLEMREMRIKDIVFSCNFNSFVDFSRTFKKYTGFSPRQYREKLLKK